MRKLFLVVSAVLLGLILAVNVVASPLTLNQITDAVCRIDNTGTGTVFGEDSTNYYILTNAHVVGRKNQVQIEFWRRGVQVVNTNGTVSWRAFSKQSDFDFAIVRVEKSKFSVPPRIIPLLPQNIQPSLTYIAAVGCPGARAPNGWEGRITQDSQTKLYFTPYPIGGQSGSGIIVLVEQDGEYQSYIGAVLTWQFSPTDRFGKVINRFGGAIPIDRFYSAYKGGTPNSIPTSYQSVSLSEVAQQDEVLWWRRNRPPYEAPYCPPQQPSPETPGNPGTTPPYIPGIDSPPVIPPATQPKIDIEIKPGEKPSVEIEVKPVEPTPETKSVFGWLEEKWNALKNYGNGALSVLFVGFGAGLTYFIWKRIIRKRVVRGVDSLQDYIQRIVVEKYGTETGQEIRVILEDIEATLLGLVDNYVDNIKTAKGAIQAKQRKRVKDVIINNPQVMTKRDKALQELLAALHEAAKDVEGGEDLITEAKKIMKAKHTQDNTND